MPSKPTEPSLALRQLLDALDTYAEACTELEQRRSEYTGYSPSYALGSWIMVKNKALKDLAAAFNEAVDERVREVLKGGSHD